MIKVDVDKKYLFSVSKIDKRTRSVYLKKYKGFSDDDRLKVHSLKFKLFVRQKHLCIKGKEGEFYFACFLMAIKHVQLNSIDLDSISVETDSFSDLFNKKALLEKNYKPFVIEMRDQGMSWRKLSQELYEKFNFKVSHNYLKTVFQIDI